MILPVYQPLGKSSHQLAAKLSRQLQTPATHTGTLDPMAEGVLLCLSGDERFGKATYSQYDKEYVFTILVGLSTDTDDLLGLVTAHQIPSQPLNLTDGFLSQFTGEQQQQLHPFSAKRIAGESFFDKAKRGEELPKTSQTITIHSLKVLSHTTITHTKLFATIESRVDLVEGDFRQPQVLASWRQALENEANQAATYQLFTLITTCSKRTYIRSLVRDFARALNQPLTTFHILRTKNGPYQIADCLCLV